MDVCRSLSHLLRRRPGLLFFFALISILILIAANVATNTNTPSTYASAISSICINPSILFPKFVWLVTFFLASNAILTFVACLTAYELGYNGQAQFAAAGAPLAGGTAQMRDGRPPLVARGEQ